MHTRPARARTHAHTFSIPIRKCVYILIPFGCHLSLQFFDICLRVTLLFIARAIFTKRKIVYIGAVGEAYIYNRQY